MMCLSLTAVDGDTVRCDGQLMRLLGGGVPFVSGIDTPEIGSHAKCIEERKLALIAKGRLKELLEERGLRIEIKGTTTRQSTDRSSTSIERMEKRSGPSCSRKVSLGSGGRTMRTTGAKISRRFELLKAVDAHAVDPLSYV